ncbi:MAG TPA: bifunctional precorrin-2 dehydrogenase/sirohydrochlorin ferrochelatase [Thermoanaerobaculia bacterium]|nr:bifunctional precorrin-2 dehydrogenase/sirohydrochlorin ferrochelatase [Thermoanaerobaculia bacterium]
MTRKQFPYYPIYLDIENRNLLIVGGGDVAARKAETLMRYGANITVVAPVLSDEIEAWAREGKLVVERTVYDETKLSGRALVIASTDSRCVNARVARDCRRRAIPVNVVDVTHLCDFIVPSVVERGSIQIAASTGGKSPAIARKIREILENSIGPEYAEINDLLGSLRKEAKRALAVDKDRKRFFEAIIARDVLALVRAGRRLEAYEIIAEECRDAGVQPSVELTGLLEGLRSTQ